MIHALALLGLARLGAACFGARELIDKQQEFFCEDFNNSVTYPNLGTFQSDYWKCKPESAEQMAPQMKLFTKSEPQGEFVNWNGTIETDNFSVLIVFTHGYVDSINRSDSIQWMEPARKALLSLPDTRGPPAILYYDWSNGAKKFWNYGQAASNTQVAGRVLGNFLLHLKKADPSLYIYLVGHSLGSHVCGQAGYWLKKQSQNQFQVDRIDGLDPAGPLFLDEKSVLKVKKLKIEAENELENSKKSESDIEEEDSDETDGFFKGFDFQWLINRLKGLEVKFPKRHFEVFVETAQPTAAPVESRLDTSDAKFVSVIHTNAYGFGVFENIGHVDFWPDGGILQTGCLPLLEIIDQRMSKCSHRFAHNVWATSITKSVPVSNLCRENIEIYDIGPKTCPKTSNSTILFGYQAERPLAKKLRSSPSGEFYYINSSLHFSSVPIDNIAEVGIRTTSFFIPTLLIVAIGLSIWRCYLRFRHNRQRTNSNSIISNHDQNQYIEAQISPNPNPT